MKRATISPSRCQPTMYLSARLRAPAVEETRGPACAALRGRGGSAACLCKRLGTSERFQSSQPPTPDSQHLNRENSGTLVTTRLRGLCCLPYTSCLDEATDTPRCSRKRRRYRTALRAEHTTAMLRVGAAGVIRADVLETLSHLAIGESPDLGE